MKSLYELFIIILYIYFGSFSYITFMIIFYFQKKMKIIKALLLFSFFAYLIIKANNKFNIPFSLFYIIFYLLGISLSLLFEDKIKNTLDIFDIHYQKIKEKAIYILFLILYPPIFTKIKCFIYNKYYYFKHPYFKPKGILYLF